jgi:hypothetical protein
MAGLFENWPNFLHELAGKLGQDLATLPNCLAKQLDPAPPPAAPGTSTRFAEQLISYPIPRRGNRRGSSYSYNP